MTSGDAARTPEEQKATQAELSLATTEAQVHAYVRCAKRIVAKEWPGLPSDRTAELAVRVASIIQDEVLSRAMSDD